MTTDVYSHDSFDLRISHGLKNKGVKEMYHLLSSRRQLSSHGKEHAADTLLLTQLQHQLSSHGKEHAADTLLPTQLQHKAIKMLGFILVQPTANA